MITKKRLKEHIDKFPERFSIDELIDRLIFIDKLEKRIAQSEHNEVIDEEDVEKEMKTWFK